MIDEGVTAPAVIPSQETFVQTKPKPRRWIQGRSDGTVVATRQAAPWLRKAIEGLNNEDGEGGRSLLCERAREIHFPDYKADSVERRLWSVLNAEYPAVRADIVEKFLLAGHIGLHETDIVQLPGGEKAARERIDVYCEMRGRDLPISVKEELALDLFEFSLLMVHGIERLDEIDAERKAAEEAFYSPRIAA